MTLRHYKRAFIFIVLITLYPYISFSQSGLLKGIVVNKETGFPISNVYLLNPDGTVITVTNSAGEFYLDKESTKNDITFHHLGYRKKTIAVDQSLSILELEPSPINMGEVTVVSTKHEKSKKEISLPIEVVDEEKILGSAAVTSSDLLKNEPGISLYREGIWSTYATIRGLTKSSIVALIDGNRIETATEHVAGLSLIDVSDIKKIEVIKGAASSLYGSGALGGIVNIITEGSNYQESLGVNGRLVSSYNSVNENSSGSLMLNMGNKNWFANLNGTLRNAGNTQTPDGVLNNSQYRNKNYSFTGGLRLIENQELNLIYQNYKATDAGIPGASTVFPSQAEVKYLEASREMFSGKYSIRNISSSLIKITGEYFYQNIFRDVENIPHTTSLIPASNNQPARRVNVLKITPQGDHTTNGVKLQSDWLFADAHYVIAGIDTWKRDLVTNRERQTLTEVLGDNSQVVSTISKIIGEKPIPDASFRSIGFFIQDEYEIIQDKLKITLGGRYDLIDIESEEVLNPLYDITNGLRNDSPTGQKKIWEAEKTNDKSWSGNLSLLYSIISDVDLTLTIARSFRSPSVEERFAFIDQGNLVKIGDPDLQPEEGTFIDAGIRIWQSDFTFTGNIFFNQLNNLVAEKPGTFEGRNALIKGNIGKARLYGFDFGTEFNFVSGWVTYAVLSYVRGEDIEKKQDLPQIPPLNGRLGIRSQLLNYIYFDLSSTLFAKQNKIAPGEIKTPGYTTFDLYLNTIPFNYSLLSLQLYTGVENIMDKSYRNHLATNRGFILSEPGRNFFVKVKVGF